MSFRPSNSAVLTQQTSAWAAKKRLKQGQVKEVVFDDEARRQYLTGFHKRKLEKKEAAKARAIEKEKAEKLEERKERRRELAERAKKNYDAVERAYGGEALDLDSDIEPSDENGLGTYGSNGKQKDVEVEYEGEEQVATVTVVEEFDIGDVNGDQPRLDATGNRQESISDNNLQKSHGSKGHSSHPTSQESSKPPRPKKFTYETKSGRKLVRRKERSRKLEKASEAKTRSRKKGDKSKGGKKRH